MTESESGASVRRSVSEVIQLAHLRKIDDAKPGARRISPRAECDFAGDGAQQRGFAGTVGAGKAELQAVGQRDADAVEDFAIAEDDGGVLDFDETFGLATGGVEGDAGRGDSCAGFGVAQLGDKGIGVVNAGFGFGGAGLRAAAEPFHLYADAVAQALLGALLPLDVGLAVFKKFGIAALYAQQAVGVNAVELDNFRGNVLQEVTVVSDHDKSKTGGAQQAFQPFDAVKIEVVRGLVEEKDLGFGHKRFGDGQPLAPAAAQARSFTIHAGIAVSVVLVKPARPSVSRSRCSRAKRERAARSSAASITWRTVIPGAKSEI